MNWRSTLAWALALPAAWLAWQETSPGRLLVSARLSLPMVSGPMAYAPSQEDRLAAGLLPVSAAQAATYRDEARASLMDRPLAPSALLAFAAGTGNDDAKRTAALLAERVTRRDMVAQLLLLQSSARLGDNARGLAHLDRVLTVSLAAAPIVHPVMTEALSDPAFREGLATYGRRPWFGGFAGFAAGASKTPGDVAALLLLAKVRDEEWFAPVARRLVEKLSAEGDVPAAASFAREALSLSDATRNAFAFTPATTRQETAPLTWHLVQDVGARATFRQGAGVEVEVDAGEATVVLKRVTALSPGTYVLDQAIEAESGIASPTLLWQLACRNLAGQPLRWSQSVPYPQGSARYRTRLVVTPDCTAQEWRLRVATIDNGTPVRFNLSEISLARQ